MITLGQATGQWASRAGERASERGDEARGGNRVTAVGAPLGDARCQQMPTAAAASWENVPNRCLMKRLESIRRSIGDVFSSAFARSIPPEWKDQTEYCCLLCRGYIGERLIIFSLVPTGAKWRIQHTLKK